LPIFGTKKVEMGFQYSNLWNIKSSEVDRKMIT